MPAKKKKVIKKKKIPVTRKISTKKFETDKDIAYDFAVKAYKKFKEGIKRQDKVNAVIKYVNGDFTEIELEEWRKLFMDDIELLSTEEKKEFLNENMRELVLSSDAFFPFRDGVDEAAKSGISAIIQPGGSIRDKEVIQAANEHGITMLFTGTRLFKH